MIEGRDVLSAQPKYGHFRREHRVQTPPLLPVLLSFLIYFLSKYCVHISDSFSLPACPVLHGLRSLGYFYSTPTISVALLHSRHAWNLCMCMNAVRRLHLSQHPTWCLPDQPFKEMHSQWWHMQSVVLYVIKVRKTAISTERPKSRDLWAA